MSRRKKKRACRVSKPVRFRGRVLDDEDLSRIQALVADSGAATLRVLATRVCQAWNWRRSNGELRLRATEDLLRRLHARGVIDLPSSPAKAVKPSRPKPAQGSSHFTPIPPAIGPREVPLQRVRVRPIDRSELAAWQEAMIRFHYLGSARIVGESIRYVAEADGRPLAFLGWGGAALKSRHREQFIGWDEQMQYQRLHLVVNNVRFLIFPWVGVPNLASRILSQNLRRLSADWEARYDHSVLLAETFVDSERFSGACYRAANWQYLGETRGMGRKGDGFVAHGRKKALFVYPLRRGAARILSGPFLPPGIERSSSMAELTIDINKLPIEGKGGLVDVLSEITDPRSRRGVRYPITSILALSMMAVLSGMRSYEAIAEWVAETPKDLLKRLRCWCSRPPSEPTFRRVLQSVDANEVDQKVGQWLAGLSEQEPIALDGKTLRGSADGDEIACHLLAAITHQTGVVVAQEQVDKKSNEITAAQPLLNDLDLEGVTVTADAMHTQTKLARFLVEEKGADYVFIAKGNQPTLRDDIAACDWDSFFPSGPNHKQGPRENRDPEHQAQR